MSRCAWRLSLAEVLPDGLYLHAMDVQLCQGLEGSACTIQGFWGRSMWVGMDVWGSTLALLLCSVECILHLDAG